MISWCRLGEEGMVTSQHGSLSCSTADLQHLVADPYHVLQHYSMQVGRSVRGESHHVFCWAPHHQMILDSHLEIRKGDTVIQLSSDRFWEEIPHQMLSLEQVPEVLSPYLGYYGYFTFELARLLETYSHRDDRLPYPYLVLDFPTRFLIRTPVDFIYMEIDLPPIPNPSVSHTMMPEIEDGLYHATTYGKYLQDLRSINNHITRGDIYQANYTQQFRILDPGLDTVKLYQSIRQQQILPHASYLNLGQFQVISLSPELFLRIEDGVVTTKPIKGTRPRGATPEEDRKLSEELQASSKDHAELSMIVDLLRNDLGKSALPGTVEVRSHALIESYENVHHLVSTVTARVEPSLLSSWRLLMRALPGGSISGVPKLRSLEIIEMYEPIPRGIYTGNIGYLGLDGVLDLNIVIRTAVVAHAQVTFNAGGGIVYDSDPVEEYIESLHKAKHLANYFRHSFSGHLSVLDGEVRLSEQIDVSPTVDGVFETILVDDGVPANWVPHYSRLTRGIAHYGLEVSAPTLEQIQEAIRINLSTSGLHRLNIYAWAGNDADHLLIRLQPYRRPIGPITLQLSRQPTVVPEAIGHGLKSLDYSVYRDATVFATEKGDWDMLLYDHDEYILEGGRSTLYFFDGSQWLTPARNVVEGTVRQTLLAGQLVRTSDLLLGQLGRMKAIALSNALAGILPVQQVRQDNKIVWQSSIDLLPTDQV